MGSKYGMSFISSEISLESAEYAQIVEEDFHAYMTRWGSSVSAEIINVAGSVQNLLEQTRYRGPAANDEQMRRAA